MGPFPCMSDFEIGEQYECATFQPTDVTTRPCKPGGHQHNYQPWSTSLDQLGSPDERRDLHELN